MEDLYVLLIANLYKRSINIWIFLNKDIQIRYKFIIIILRSFKIQIIIFI